MLRDVPHLKAMLALTLGGMMVLAICAWVYPGFKARCGDARIEATRYVWSDMYGISDGSIPLVQTGGELTDEMCRAAGEPVPQALPGGKVMLNSVTTDASAPTPQTQ